MQNMRNTGSVPLFSLVFQGKLGVEEGAVVGREVKVETVKELLLYTLETSTANLPVARVYDLETKQVSDYKGVLPFDSKNLAMWG
jgi:hypothetical protein